MADGLNDERATRVADLLSDFRALQHSIASILCDPPHPDDFYTEGYAALRQCSIDGQHILNVAADTQVLTAGGGQAEQEKAELSQVLLDSFSRRHEAQKICMRQSAAMRSVAWREGVLMGMRPNATHAPALAACDQALRAELATVADENIYNSMRSSDYNMGRWADEDPPLRNVQRWLRSRRCGIYTSLGYSLGAASIFIRKPATSGRY